MIFRSKEIASRFIKNLEELNIMAEGSVEYSVINDEYESILDRHIQCRHHDCGTCNGVACEDSHFVEIDSKLFLATKSQRDKATNIHRKHVDYGYDDRGGCHL